jgi:hypothetical protein
VNAKILFNVPNIAANDIADAASDVWEPLLRDLLELQAECECPYGSCAANHAAFDRAKEALDG